MKIDQEKKEIEIVLSFVDIRGKDVLEIGCGDGRFSRIILELGAKSLIAIDCDPEMIRSASLFLKNKWPNSSFQNGVGENLSFLENNSFDLVVFSFSLHEHGAPFFGLQEAFMKMKPEGEMIIIEPKHDGEFCQFLAPIFSEEKIILLADQAIQDFVCANKRCKEFSMNWLFESPEELLADLLKFEKRSGCFSFKATVRNMVSNFPPGQPIIIKDKAICWWLKK